MCIQVHDRIPRKGKYLGGSLDQISQGKSCFEVIQDNFFLAMLQTGFISRIGHQFDSVIAIDWLNVYLNL